MPVAVAFEMVWTLTLCLARQSCCSSGRTILLAAAQVANIREFGCLVRNGCVDRYSICNHGAQVGLTAAPILKMVAPVKFVGFVAHLHEHSMT